MSEHADRLMSLNRKQLIAECLSLRSELAELERLRDAEPRWAVTPADVDFEWDDLDGKIHVDFEREKALAVLLINDVVYCNNFWYEDKWPEDAKKCINLFVNVNDVFAPASDAERLHYDQIQPLYRQWQRDPSDGVIAWCISVRRRLPWRERSRTRMIKNGYDLDALMRGELP